MRIHTIASYILVVGCLPVSVGTSRADLIDFEVGYSRLEPVTTVATATNAVTISLQGGKGTTPFIAQVGTMPKDAFEKVVEGVIQGDSPQGGNPGRYFLTDGAGDVGNYLFDLQNPIGQFSVDLYDYVGDGGAAPTDFVTLNAYSDSARLDFVAAATYVVPRPRPVDGLVVTLTVSAPSIAALTLEFSTFDRGTGVDNIQFVTVPEPAAMALALSAVVIFLAGGRRLRR